ncbi:transposase [Leptolyngbya sp. FACHB-321]|uniref:transposase n=1 Tax=Leptolyngbya sp. FACHB-321 TaxID=2692807 RepID=UPI0016853E22|nr:transposase [Leptolyngbya sp. FACHB-321]
MSAIKPHNLVFLDEMGVLLGLMRLMGRAPKGERVYDIKPFYRGTRVNVINALSDSKVLALKALKRSLSVKQFKVFLQEHVVPQLWPGTVVVMDNLPAHKVQGVHAILAAVGAKALYLSPYSPEFNPIEHWWWELKAFIRRFVPKTKETLVKLLHMGLC